ncbi:hypothetical protein OUZ56_032691 [Daphnia magna]|uniref:Uncharacterized protein n=1 Tax=Daphnia magna TaxID=35525 RepID=A0ABQ9ZXT5_9CRUS|nr:hypothetical protein OUZ56_032691 [Daphnia magna]
MLLVEDLQGTLAAEDAPSNELTYLKQMFKFIGRGKKSAVLMLDYLCLFGKCKGKAIPSIKNAGSCSRYHIRRHVKVNIPYG